MAPSSSGSDFSDDSPGRRSIATQMPSQRARPPASQAKAVQFPSFSSRTAPAQADTAEPTPTTKPQTLRKHRLWQQRASRASPDARARLDVGHALTAFGFKYAAASRGPVANEQQENSDASSGGAQEQPRQEQVPQSRHPTAGPGRAGAAKQDQRARSPGPDLSRLRRSRHWRGRVSAASPERVAARRVAAALGDWTFGVMSTSAAATKHRDRTHRHTRAAHHDHTPDSDSSAAAHTPQQHTTQPALPSHHNDDPVHTQVQTKQASNSLQHRHSGHGQVSNSGHAGRASHAGGGRGRMQTPQMAHTQPHVAPGGVGDYTHTMGSRVSQQGVGLTEQTAAPMSQVPANATPGGRRGEAGGSPVRLAPAGWPPRRPAQTPAVELGLLSSSSSGDERDQRAHKQHAITAGHHHTAARTHMHSQHHTDMDMGHIQAHHDQYQRQRSKVHASQKQGLLHESAVGHAGWDGYTVGDVEAKSQRHVRGQSYNGAEGLAWEGSEGHHADADLIPAHDGSRARGAAQSPVAATAARLRRHRLWRERESAASPAARSATRVSQVMSDFLGGPHHTPSHHPGPHTHLHDSQYDPDSAEHDMYEGAQDYDTAQQGYEGSAYDRQFVQGLGGYTGHADSQIAGRGRGAYAAVVADAARHKSLQRLRQHRLWRERESSASPERRAARDVQSFLHAWAADAAVGAPPHEKSSTATTIEATNTHAERYHAQRHAGAVDVPDDAHDGAYQHAHVHRQGAPVQAVAPGTRSGRVQSDTHTDRQRSGGSGAKQGVRSARIVSAPAAQAASRGQRSSTPTEPRAAMAAVSEHSAAPVQAARSPAPPSPLLQRALAGHAALSSPSPARDRPAARSRQGGIYALPAGVHTASHHSQPARDATRQIQSVSSPPVTHTHTSRHSAHVPPHSASHYSHTVTSHPGYTSHSVSQPRSVSAARAYEYLGQHTPQYWQYSSAPIDESPGPLRTQRRYDGGYTQSQAHARESTHSLVFAAPAAYAAHEAPSPARLPAGPGTAAAASTGGRGARRPAPLSSTSSSADGAPSEATFRAASDAGDHTTLFTSQQYRPHPSRAHTSTSTWLPQPQLQPQPQPELSSLLNLPDTRVGRGLAGDGGGGVSSVGASLDYLPAIPAITEELTSAMTRLNTALEQRAVSRASSVYSSPTRSTSRSPSPGILRALSQSRSASPRSHTDRRTGSRYSPPPPSHQPRYSHSHHRLATIRPVSSPSAQQGATPTQVHNISPLARSHPSPHTQPRPNPHGSPTVRLHYAFIAAADDAPAAAAGAVGVAKPTARRSATTRDAEDSAVGAAGSTDNHSELLHALAGLDHILPSFTDHTVRAAAAAETADCASVEAADTAAVSVAGAGSVAGLGGYGPTGSTDSKGYVARGPRRGPRSPVDNVAILSAAHVVTEALTATLDHLKRAFPLAASPDTHSPHKPRTTPLRPSTAARLAAVDSPTKGRSAPAEFGGLQGEMGGESPAPTGKGLMAGPGGEVGGKEAGGKGVQSAWLLGTHSPHTPPPPALLSVPFGDGVVELQLRPSAVKWYLAELAGEPRPPQPPQAAGGEGVDTPLAAAPPRSAPSDAVAAAAAVPQLLQSTPQLPVQDVSEVGSADGVDWAGSAGVSQGVAELLARLAQVPSRLQRAHTHGPGGAAAADGVAVPSTTSAPMGSQGISQAPATQAQAQPDQEPVKATAKSDAAQKQPQQFAVANVESRSPALQPAVQATAVADVATATPSVAVRQRDLSPVPGAAMGGAQATSTSPSFVGVGGVHGASEAAAVTAPKGRSVTPLTVRDVLRAQSEAGGGTSERRRSSVQQSFATVQRSVTPHRMRSLSPIPADPVLAQTAPSPLPAPVFPINQPAATLSTDDGQRQQPVCDAPSFMPARATTDDDASSPSLVLRAGMTAVYAAVQSPSFSLSQPQSQLQPQSQSQQHSEQLDGQISRQEGPAHSYVGPAAHVAAAVTVPERKSALDALLSAAKPVHTSQGKGPQHVPATLGLGGKPGAQESSRKAGTGRGVVRASLPGAHTAGPKGRATDITAMLARPFVLPSRRLQLKLPDTSNTHTTQDPTTTAPPAPGPTNISLAKVTDKDDSLPASSTLIAIHPQDASEAPGTSPRGTGQAAAPVNIAPPQAPVVPSVAQLSFTAAAGPAQCVGVMQGSRQRPMQERGGMAQGVVVVSPGPFPRLLALQQGEGLSVGVPPGVHRNGVQAGMTQTKAAGTVQVKALAALKQRSQARHNPTSRPPLARSTDTLALLARPAAPVQPAGTRPDGALSLRRAPRVAADHTAAAQAAFTTPASRITKQGPRSYLTSSNSYDTAAALYDTVTLQGDPQQENDTQGLASEHPSQLLHGDGSVQTEDSQPSLGGSCELHVTGSEGDGDNTGLNFPACVAGSLDASEHETAYEGADDTSMGGSDGAEDLAAQAEDLRASASAGPVWCGSGAGGACDVSQSCGSLGYWMGVGVSVGAAYDTAVTHYAAAPAQPPLPAAHPLVLNDTQTPPHTLQGTCSSALAHTYENVDTLQGTTSSSNSAETGEAAVGAVQAHNEDSVLSGLQRSGSVCDAGGADTGLQQTAGSSDGHEPTSGPVTWDGAGVDTAALSPALSPRSHAYFHASIEAELEALIASVRLPRWGTRRPAVQQPTQLQPQPQQLTVSISPSDSGATPLPLQPQDPAAVAVADSHSGAALAAAVADMPPAVAAGPADALAGTMGPPQQLSPAGLPQADESVLQAPSDGDAGLSPHRSTCNSHAAGEGLDTAAPAPMEPGSPHAQPHSTQATEPSAVYTDPSPSTLTSPVSGAVVVTGGGVPRSTGANSVTSRRMSESRSEGGVSQGAEGFQVWDNPTYAPSTGAASTTTTTTTTTIAALAPVHTHRVQHTQGASSHPADSTHTDTPQTEATSDSATSHLSTPTAHTGAGGGTSAGSVCSDPPHARVFELPSSSAARYTVGDSVALTERDGPAGKAFALGPGPELAEPAVGIASQITAGPVAVPTIQGGQGVARAVAMTPASRSLTAHAAAQSQAARAHGVSSAHAVRALPSQGGSAMPATQRAAAYIHSSAVPALLPAEHVGSQAVLYDVPRSGSVNGAAIPSTMAGPADTVRSSAPLTHSHASGHTGAMHSVLAKWGAASAVPLLGRPGQLTSTLLSGLGDYSQHTDGGGVRVTGLVTDSPSVPTRPQVDTPLVLGKRRPHRALLSSSQPGRVSNTLLGALAGPEQPIQGPQTVARQGSVGVVGGMRASQQHGDKERVVHDSAVVQGVHAVPAALVQTLAQVEPGRQVEQGPSVVRPPVAAPLVCVASKARAHSTDGPVSAKGAGNSVSGYGAGVSASAAFDARRSTAALLERLNGMNRATRMSAQQLSSLALQADGRK